MGALRRLLGERGALVDAPAARHERAALGHLGRGTVPPVSMSSGRFFGEIVMNSLRQ